MLPFPGETDFAPRISQSLGIRLAQNHPGISSAAFLMLGTALSVLIDRLQERVALPGPCKGSKSSIQLRVILGRVQLAPLAMLLSTKEKLAVAPDATRTKVEIARNRRVSLAGVEVGLPSSHALCK